MCGRLALAALLCCVLLPSVAAAETLRLVRWGAPGAERPGLIDGDDVLRDLSGVVDDLAGPVLGRLDELAALDPAGLPRVPGEPRLGPPVGCVGKIIALGFNYADHAAESDVELPTEPLLFSKAVTALAGPRDPIVPPRGSTKLDYEAELVIAIGRRARYVSVAEATDFIAGFAAGHDVSERAFQRERGGQFLKGKSADGFAPLGPWLVPAAQIADVQALDVFSRVNGEPRQRSNTRHMVFPAAFAVSYVSRFMTLEPGDLIFTGTPAGVGAGMDPPRWLRTGDVVEIGIEGLGVQRQAIAAPEPPGP